MIIVIRDLLGFQVGLPTTEVLLCVGAWVQNHTQSSSHVDSSARGIKVHVLSRVLTAVPVNIV